MSRYIGNQYKFTDANNKSITVEIDTHDTSRRIISGNIIEGELEGATKQRFQFKTCELQLSVVELVGKADQGFNNIHGSIPTIYAQNIETPSINYFAIIRHPSYINYGDASNPDIAMPPKRILTRILAETKEGAEKIIAYHHLKSTYNILSDKEVKKLIGNNNGTFYMKDQHKSMER